VRLRWDEGREREERNGEKLRWEALIKGGLMGKDVWKRLPRGH
jgi:hypothetical protein